MNCNHHNNNTDVAQIRHVYGNVLRLAIPLTLRTLTLDGGTVERTDEPFYPSSEYPVEVVLSKGATKVRIAAEMDGNVASIEDDGTIPIGVFSITVTCRDDNGRPYRFKQHTVLNVVDTTREAGIEPTIEYEAATWYLDAAIYLAMKGEDGVGIESITTQSSAEVGGMNTVTITLTDGTVKEFTIMNGSGSVDKVLDPNSSHPVANSVLFGKFSTIDQALGNLFGDVAYDTNSKAIVFYNKDRSKVLATLDARPFIKDGMVNSVYISNNTLVITFNTDSGREAIGVPLSSVFNPNNYYTKTQIDNRFSSISTLNAETYINKSYLGRDNNVSSAYMPHLVLYSMGHPYDEGNDSSVEQGQPYFYNGYISIQGDSMQVLHLGEPSMKVIYCNAKTNKAYRWNGSEFILIRGGEVAYGYLLAPGRFISMTYNTSTHGWESDSTRIPNDPYVLYVDVTTNKLYRYDYNEGHVLVGDGGGGSGTQVQSDWAEEDASDPAYIRNKPTIPVVPTNVSAFDNDAGYLTEHQDISGKVDKVSGKGLSSEDYTAEEKTKLAGLENYDDTALAGRVRTLERKEFVETDPTVPQWAKQPSKPSYTAREVGALPDTTVIPSKTSNLVNDSGFLTQHQDVSGKADKSDTYTKAQVDTLVADAGKVKTVTVNGTKHTPDASTGDVNLGNLRGQDGNSGVASADGVESVNNLNGGTTDTTSRVYVLGANQGKRLRDQIEYVYQRLQSIYSALGNIAFWDEKPAASTLLPELDWGNPKHTVTLVLSLTNAVVKHNGVAVADRGTIQVEEGSKLTLTVEPASGYALTGAPTVSTGATVTDLGNGTYSVAIVMGQSDIALSIAATGAAAYSITLNLANCTKVNGPTYIMSGGSATIVFDADDGYALPSTAPTVVGASIVSWDNTTGELVINTATGAVTVTVDAVIATPYQGDLVLWLDGADDNTALASKWVDRIGGVEFPISGAITRSGSHYQFAGTWGQKDALMGSTEDLIFAYADHTVEVVFKPMKNNNASFVCVFGKQDSSDLSGLYFSLNKVKTGESGPYINGMYLDGTTNVWKASEYDVNKIYCFGLNKAVGLQNGTPLASLGLNHWNYCHGGRWIGCGETNIPDGMGGNAAFVGEVYAVRIYRGQLTAAQMLANQKIDNERYGLGLTLPDSIS